MKQNAGDLVYFKKMRNSSSSKNYVETTAKAGEFYAGLLLGYIPKGESDLTVGETFRMVHRELGAILVDDIAEALGNEQFEKLLKFIKTKYAKENDEKLLKDLADRDAREKSEERLNFALAQSSRRVRNASPQTN